jgi:hypothetical protein
MMVEVADLVFAFSVEPETAMARNSNPADYQDWFGDDR